MKQINSQPQSLADAKEWDRLLDSDEGVDTFAALMKAAQEEDTDLDCGQDSTPD